MKHLITAALLLIGNSLIAQTEPPLPEDASKIQASYRAACQRALAPIQNTYRAELEKLLGAHTKAGRLDAALAIRNELNALTEATSSQTTSTKERKLPTTPRQLETFLENSTWEWLSTRDGKTDSRLVLSPKGKAMLIDKPYNWHATGKRSVMLGGTTLEFSEDCMSFSCRWGELPRFGKPVPDAAPR